MATANINAAHQQPCKKALAHDAMNDLCKFISITKENQHALNVLNEYLRQERPVIDVSTKSDGLPYFYLSKPLASFISDEVAA